MLVSIECQKIIINNKKAYKIISFEAPTLKMLPQLYLETDGYQVYKKSNDSICVSDYQNSLLTFNLHITINEIYFEDDFKLRTDVINKAVSRLRSIEREIKLRKNWKGKITSNFFYRTDEPRLTIISEKTVIGDKRAVKIVSITGLKQDQLPEEYLIGNGPTVIVNSDNLGLSYGDEDFEDFVEIFTDCVYSFDEFTEHCKFIKEACARFRKIDKEKSDKMENWFGSTRFRF